MSAALLALLLISGFSDPISCTVQGYLSKPALDAPVEFTREDTCVGIRATWDDRLLVLYSPYVWVSIIVPVAPGHARFWYRWHSREAHLGTESLPVDWGPVGGRE